MLRRPIRVVLAAALVCVSATLPGLAAPAAVEAASPTAAAPMRVRFEAGTHTGYLYSSSNRIIGTKTATLPAPSGATTVRRATVPGHGVQLLIRDGIWAGYWVPESIASYVPGIVGENPFAAPRRLHFPAGHIVGYRFAADWSVASAKIMRLSSPSGASASMMAAINGIPHYRIVDGGLAGTWVKGGAAGAVATLGCRTGSRATGGAAVWSTVPGAGPEVALTFDLGGRTDPAMSIVKRLLQYGVCTTLFPTGDATGTTAGRAALQFAAAYPQVFEIGNHTKDHCDLVNGGGDTGCPTSPPSATFIQSQLTSAASTISSATGQDPRPYWRPPYGTHNASVRSAAAAVGYTKTVMWHIDTIDWRPPPPTDNGPTAAQIASKVTGTATGGSIVLMHLGGWNTYDALPSMVRGLTARGLQPTTISDLADGS